jgi:cysteine desulfurase
MNPELEANGTNCRGNAEVSGRLAAERAPRSLRAVTENVAGIAARAVAAAAQRHFAAEAAHMLALCNRLESGLKAISPHAVTFGEAAGRLPNTTLFAVEGM